MTIHIGNRIKKRANALLVEQTGNWQHGIGRRSGARNIPRNRLESSPMGQRQTQKPDNAAGTRRNRLQVPRHW